MNEPETTQRQSRRTKKPPNYFKDYVIDDDFDALAFNAETFVDDVPETYDDIKGRTDEKCWK